LVDEFRDYFAAVRYHAWWPSAGDPYYQYNRTENETRIQYYPPHTDGYYYTPYVWIDGNIRGGYNSGSWQTLMLNRYDEPSPLDIQLFGTFDDTSREGELVIDILATDVIEYDELHIMIALTESNIFWQAPNNSQWHHQTMRDMIPNATGTIISISEGESVQLIQEFSCPDPIVTRNAELVVFAQAPSNDGREILQAARSWVEGLQPTGIDDETDVPERFALEQNYPNPFNAETKISFYTDGGDITLQVFDLTGSLVRTLADGAYEAGEHSITWDGRDQNGADVASGVYFYRLSSRGGDAVRRMTLIK
jgi:hypothetical protein